MITKNYLIFRTASDGSVCCYPVIPNKPPTPDLREIVPDDTCVYAPAFSLEPQSSGRLALAHCILRDFIGYVVGDEAILAEFVQQFLVVPSTVSIFQVDGVLIRRFLSEREFVIEDDWS